MSEPWTHATDFRRTSITLRPIALPALVVAATMMLSGCEGMTTGQKGAATGAALGTGIAMVTGAGLATTIGAGLIGGAAGYLGGEAISR